MAETIVPENITKELRAIKEDLSYIKMHMVDIDSILTEEDYRALQSYHEEKRAGKLISHKQLKKEIGV